ncbi:5-methylcytosine-specific restriction endonuclease McrA [Variovorax boronicumulans]|uniref:HNH endonuclease n=1 Tax=Variovorax boronicumulans TaxID=436515 RepID=UPI002781854A|nr:hypothetical protein [Variovorax boronicumulans]MDP9908886.1 5-methylcytosine-specific restriction endonuclease McrA [Variovorax boronicumulans]
MKRLPRPDIDPKEVYEVCVSGVSSADLAARFKAATAEVVELAQEYMARAATNELHLFPSSPWGNGASLVVGDLTKDDLTDLYSSYMVKSSQPGRAYYDRITLLAPLGKCPLCGFGQVSTLDHFLSKSRYPSFSVLPVNLVPACSDCNTGKGAGVLDAENQIPHPYFEDERIETESWLYASVNETSPATATFSVVPPGSWPPELAKRVTNFFQELDLASRFAVEAASELTSLSDFLGLLETGQQLSGHLGLVAQTERTHRKNSWKAALYEALAESVWYCKGGYRRPAA